MSFSGGPTTMMRRLAAVTAAAVLLAAGGATALPQPEGVDSKPREAGASRRVQEQPRDGLKNRPIAREALKKRLEKRLSEARDAQKKLEEAIKAMDGGASPEDLRKLLPEQGALRGVLDENEPPEGPFSRGEGSSGRFGGHDGDGKGGERRAMTEQDQPAIREVLQIAAPEMAKSIDELMKKDPEAARKRLAELFPRMRGLLEMRDREPRLYKLRLEDLTLARQSIPLAKELLAERQANTDPTTPESKAKLQQLRQLIDKQFENRLLGMGFEIESLQSRIEEKQRQLAKMKSEQPQTVDRIMESLIKRADKPGLEKELFGPGRGGPGGPGSDRPGPGGPDGDGGPPPPPERRGGGPG